MSKLGFSDQPALWVGAAGSVIAVAVAFGLPVTQRESDAILAAIPAVAAVLTWFQVTPVGKAADAVWAARQEAANSAATAALKQAGPTSMPDPLDQLVTDLNAKLHARALEVISDAVDQAFAFTPRAPASPPPPSVPASDTTTGPVPT